MARGLRNVNCRAARVPSLGRGKFAEVGSQLRLAGPTVGGAWDSVSGRARP